ncbi:MAG: DUF2269 family protein, partial [Comamonas sp.]
QAIVATHPRAAVFDGCTFDNGDFSRLDMDGFQFNQCSVAGACWLPVVWLQMRMASLAHGAQTGTNTLPALYLHYQRRWELLGYPAFVAMAATYFLMVNKPALWS